MVNGEPVSGTSQIIQFNGNNLGYKFTFIELPNGLKDPQNAVVKYVAPPMEEEKAWNYSDSNERIQSFEFTGSFVNEWTPTQIKLIEDTIVAANAQRTHQ